MKKKRILSWILAIALVLSSLPISAFLPTAVSAEDALAIVSHTPEIDSQTDMSSVMPDAQLEVTFNKDIQIIDENASFAYDVLFTDNDGSGTTREGVLSVDSEDSTTALITLVDDQQFEAGHSYTVATSALGGMLSLSSIASANDATEKVDISGWVITVEDALAIVSHTPEIDSQTDMSSVMPDTQLKVTFNKDIQIIDENASFAYDVLFTDNDGSGTTREGVLSVDSEDSTTALITLVDDQQFEAGHSYTVATSALGGMLSLSSIASASDATEKVDISGWVITVEDALAIVSHTPEIDSQTDMSSVMPDTQLEVTFNKDIQIIDENTSFAYDVLFTDNDGSGTTREGVLSVDSEDSTTALITLVDDQQFEAGHSYTVATSALGGMLSLSSIASASDETETVDISGWVITVEDALAIVSHTPEIDSQTDMSSVMPDTQLKVTFNKDIQIIDENTSFAYDVLFTDNDGSGTTREGVLSVDSEDSTTALITLVDDQQFEAGHSYTVATSALGGMLSLSSIASASDETETVDISGWVITVEDEGLTATLSPVSGTANVSTDTVFTITFNKAVTVTNNSTDEFDLVIYCLTNEDENSLASLIPNQDNTVFTLQIDEEFPLKADREYLIADYLDIAGMHIPICTIQTIDGSETFTFPEWMFDTYLAAGSPNRVDITGNSVLKVGSNTTLSADVYDAENALLSGEAVAWSSSDDSIATVDAAGTVTGVSSGTVTITAMCVSDTDVKGTYTIDVSDVQAYDMTMTLRVLNGTKFRDDITGCTLGDGVVYAIRNNHGSGCYIYAYDLMGNQIWGVTPDSYSSTDAVPVVADDGTIYVQGSSVLYALNPDGSYVWDEPIMLENSNNNDVSNTQPTIAGDLLIVTRRYAVYAYNRHTQETVWSYVVDNDGLSASADNYKINQNAVVADGNVYVKIGGTSANVADGKMQALDLATGQKNGVLFKMLLHG